LSLSAGLIAPLYTGGAREAQLDGATASQQAAIAAYGAAALTAFEEVETALTNERLLTEREGFLQSIRQQRV
jgi:multidrug efflux system outer membrane protein